MLKKMLVLGLAGIFLMQLFSALVSSNLPNSDFSFKAAIIDSLGPNPVFNETVTRILEENGFTVDHYSDKQVTVNFYRELPTKGYGIIILRTHTAAAGLSHALSFFTSEQYNPTSYTFEQLTDQVTQVAPIEIPAPTGRNQTYLGVTPSIMKGRFQNTIIIAMSCSSFDPHSAETLIQRGAKAYFGWRNWVGLSRTDRAIVYLLEHLLIKKQTIEQAVTETMNRVGPDREYNSTLEYYPPEAGNYTISSAAR